MKISSIKSELKSVSPTNKLPVFPICSLVEYLQLVNSVRRERRHLAKLSDSQLDDLGISRAEANAEASRGWPDLPKSRMSGIDSKVVKPF